MFLDGLFSQWLVFIDLDERDQRRQVLRISDAGREMLGQIEARIDRVELELLQAFSAAERSDLHLAVTRLLTYANHVAAQPVKSVTPAAPSAPSVGSDVAKNAAVGGVSGGRRLG